MADKGLMDKLMELFMKTAQVKASYGFDRVRFDFYDNSAIGYCLDGRSITKFYAEASVMDGRRITSRSAKLKSVSEEESGDEWTLCVIYEAEHLRLSECLTVKRGEPWFRVRATVKDLANAVTESNYLAPLDFAYPDKNCLPLFLSLDQKMLLVPYDNDMWVRYESAPLRPGRSSYDLTAIYDENTNEGLIIGALEYDTWKNAIRVSQSDARCCTAFSGVADAGTHDICPHGSLTGGEVSSALFLCGFVEDVRDGLEDFGRLAMEGKFAFRWPHPVPFGWNSYSAGCMSLEQWEAAADYFYEELPEFCGGEGAACINLDANFLLNEKKMKQLVNRFHERGQKAGNYMAPLLGIEQLASVMPLRGSFGKTYKDIIMKTPDGQLYPRIDGGKPVDITHPAAEKHVRETIRHIAELGFDYLKIDFTAHGSVEGPHYDPTVRTGRQALMRFYQILAEELDPEKLGRDIFVDLSIAPLFPGGFAHGRRACCDAFGHHEDVRYVLNALNFGWWQSGTLYCYNDPDHTVLYRSAVDGRAQTDLASARSRYNASVISGTVMLLSDNFGPETGFGADPENVRAARERVAQLANRPALNAVARLGRPFRPAWLKSDTCPIYYLHHEGKHYLAFFNFEDRPATLQIAAEALGMPACGTMLRLDSDGSAAYDGSLAWELDAFDSAVFEIQA